MTAAGGHDAWAGGASPCSCVILGAALLWCGCSSRAYLADERLAEGLIVVLPGIEGPSGYNATIRKGFADAGLTYAIEIYDWRAGRNGASYAFDQAGARQRAAECAAHVRDYRGQHPGRPVFLVGHSGGGAMAVFVAEAMPPGEPLDGAILLAPALGPEYDLTTGLEGCNGRILSCSASNDFLLRTLTTVGQNFDGAKGKTAGQMGFKLPAGADEKRGEAFTALRQLHWDLSMLKKGNWGGHFGWADPIWVRDVLGPVIRDWAASRAAQADDGG